MKKIDKETLAIYLVIGLVVFGLVIYGFFSTSKGKTTTQVTEVQKAKSMFSAPSDPTKKEKEEYKSTLDNYEELAQKQEEEEQQKTMKQSIGFNKPLEASTLQNGNNKEQKQKEVQAQTVTVQPIAKTSLAQQNKTQKVKSEAMEQHTVTEEEPKETEQPTRRKLVSASQDRTEPNQKKETENPTDKKIDDLPNEVPVVVHGDQTILSGQRIRLRVTKAAKVGGYTIDEDQILSGTCTFTTDRVKITVYSFRSDGQTVKMKLYAYDNGELGIYATTNTNQEIANQTAQQVTQRVRFTIRTPVGSVPIGGGAGTRKIAEQERKFEITSQYNLTLSDKEQ
jgi:hypothetical protein